MTYRIDKAGSSPARLREVITNLPGPAAVNPQTPQTGHSWQAVPAPASGRKVPDGCADNVRLVDSQIGDLWLSRVTSDPSTLTFATRENGLHMGHRPVAVGDRADGAARSHRARLQGHDQGESRLLHHHPGEVRPADGRNSAAGLRLS